VRRTLSKKIWPRNPKDIRRKPSDRGDDSSLNSPQAEVIPRDFSPEGSGVHSARLPSRAPVSRPNAEQCDAHLKLGHRCGRDRIDERDLTEYGGAIFLAA
jgi:hypothetical protein